MSRLFPLLIDLDLEDALKQRNILGELIASMQCLHMLTQLKLQETVTIFRCDTSS